MGFRQNRLEIGLDLAIDPDARGIVDLQRAARIIGLALLAGQALREHDIGRRALRISEQARGGPHVRRTIRSWIVTTSGALRRRLRGGQLELVERGEADRRRPPGRWRGRLEAEDDAPVRPVEQAADREGDAIGRNAGRGGEQEVPRRGARPAGHGSTLEGEDFGRGGDIRGRWRDSPRQHVIGLRRRLLRGGEGK